MIDASIVQCFNIRIAEATEHQSSLKPRSKWVSPNTEDDLSNVRLPDGVLDVTNDLLSIPQLR